MALYRRERGAILHVTPDCAALRRSGDVVEIPDPGAGALMMLCKICCSGEEWLRRATAAGWRGSRA